MNETAFHAAQLKILQSGAIHAIDPKAIITGMRLADGSYHALSLYGDPIWILPDSLFPAGTAEFAKKLNFTLVPSAFLDITRFCMARYMVAGIEGSVRPRGSTLVAWFRHTVRLLAWLDDRGIGRLSDTTPLVAQQFVDFCKGSKGRNGKALSAGGLTNRLAAVEILHILSQQTADPMPRPWRDSSALHLAGWTGANTALRRKAKTEVIPDDVLGPLFQSCVDWLERADEIMHMQAQVDAWKTEGRSATFIQWRTRKQGWKPSEISSAAFHLQSACMCIIFVTSGIRVSELCSLETGCAFTKQGDYGDLFHWMRGTSYKTRVGLCEWLVAEVTYRAIGVAERLARPLQARLGRLISELRAENPLHPEITRLSEHADRLFLAATNQKNGRILTLSARSIETRINIFAAQCGIDWHFTPHQFRRTFAVYAAHSTFGDLRYLRDHFKHWSLDMTSIYAMNDRQDSELFDAVGLAALGIKMDLLEHWLEPDALITGGAAAQVRTFRSKNEVVVTKEGRAELAKSISPLVHVRATGVAWCTADTGGCNGGQGVEKTRCGPCSNAVIDESLKPVWRGIYAQQLELRNLPDIGPSGRERVERDITRCEAVLKDLGATEEDLANVATCRQH